MKKVFKVLFANSVALFVGVPLYFIISIFLTNSLREQYIVDSTQGSDNDMDFITNNLLSFIEQNPFVDFSIFDRWKIQPSLRNDGSCLFHYYKSRDCDWKNDTMILFSGRKYFLNKDTTYLITNDSLHDISFSD